MHGGRELLREENEMKEMDRRKSAGNFDFGRRPSVAPESGMKVLKASGSVKQVGRNVGHQRRIGTEDGDVHCA